MSDDTLNRYLILGKLGEGGMGVLFRAKDTRLGRTVALKVLRPEAVADPDRKRRFVQEAQAASALSHPSIVTVFDIGEDPDQGTFIVMECLDGESLRERLARGPLEVAEALRIATEMTRALAAAHAAGIVHRDVKPANVMVTSSGSVKVLDFGLAKLFQVEGAADSTHAATVTAPALTAQGIVMGTPAYMSPEQAQGRPVDARSDVFSLGAVLYEMLAGRRPFEGANEISLLSAILRDKPPALHGLRADVDPPLEKVVARCLEKDPEARYPSAAALLADLEKARARATPAARASSRGRSALTTGLVVLALLALGAAAWSWRRRAGEQRARRESLPEIARLTDAGDVVAAFALAEKVRPLLPGDPQLEKLWKDIVLPATFHTEPEGADVHVKAYARPEAEWQHLGRTPIEKRDLPLAYLRFRFTKPGYAPAELATMALRVPPLRLVPEAEVPPDMVLVPAGRAAFRRVPELELPEFWLDRHEVTNEQFKEFVDGGGYERRELWKHPFAGRGRRLSFEEAMRVFRDETGRPGPATWELGSYREGRARFPVSGVSWYEAAAYAEFAGKSLPTFQQWYRAADLGIFSEVLQFSNFGGDGPRAVGAQPALSGFGNYDMAGNVREWVWNAAGDRRYTLGGAWSDPTYLFTGPDALDPLDRSPILGLRCARNLTPPPPASLGPIDEAVRDVSKLRPVGDDVFRVYAAALASDPADLGARVEATDDSSPHWRVETVSFTAAYGGERVPARLFLPKNARPPFQAVVYFPPASALRLRSSEGLGSREFGFLVRSGRAVLFPTYQGTYERRRPNAPRGPTFLRDLITQRIRDVRRSVDYLESRPEIDKGKLAFYGLSMGADMGPLIGAVEDRMRALVLVAGGLSVDFPEEVDPVHFAPRVRIPVVMINGRYDFTEPLESSQRPLFRLLGTPEPDKRHAVFDSGHVAPWPSVVKESLDWLDRSLGPVPRVAAPNP